MSRLRYWRCAAVAKPFFPATKSASIGTQRPPCPSATIAAKLFFTPACKGLMAPATRHRGQAAQVLVGIGDHELVGVVVGLERPLHEGVVEPAAHVPGADHRVELRDVQARLARNRQALG